MNNIIYVKTKDNIKLKIGLTKNVFSKVFKNKILRKIVQIKYQ